MTHFGRLEIYITLFQIPTLMSESLLGAIVLPSLDYPYFELQDIEQDEIRKPWLIKQETK